MLDFATPYMKQNKSRKQTLESAQCGLEISFKRDHVRKQTNIYFYISSRAALNKTFTAKYNGVLLRTP